MTLPASLALLTFDARALRHANRLTAANAVLTHGGDLQKEAVNKKKNGMLACKRKLTSGVCRIGRRESSSSAMRGYANASGSLSS